VLLFCPASRSDRLVKVIIGRFGEALSNYCVPKMEKLQVTAAGIFQISFVNRKKMPILASARSQSAGFDVKRRRLPTDI
jgi:hypothetical protein